MAHSDSFVRAAVFLTVVTFLLSSARSDVVPAAPRLLSKGPSIVAAPVSELVLDSDPGDYIGAGQHLTYTLADSTFAGGMATTDGNGAPTYVTIQVHGPQPIDSWFLQFSSTQIGRPLAVGFFDKAERAPFASAGHPGVDVSGQGRGCNTLIGRFTVLDAAIDATTRRVTRFAASFEQHCERMEPALRGHLYFNYSAPSSVTLSPTVVGGGDSSTGTVTLPAPAPVGGTSVTLASSHPELASVPAAITVVEGASSTSFPITTFVQKYLTAADVVASIDGVGAEATLSVVSPIPSITGLDMTSDPGDYVGGGLTYHLTASTGQFSVYAGSFNSGPDTNVAGFGYLAYPGTSSLFWFGDFSTRMLGTPLTPGVTYPNGERYPFESAGRPGLDVFGDGRGCNMLTGSFRVVALELDEDFSPPVVLSMAIEFEQHCEGDVPALHGQFYYRYTPPSDCTLDCPADIAVAADSSSGADIGAVVQFDTPATDCPSTVVTCAPASGFFFPAGTTPVTCTADQGGVPAAQCTFNVSVSAPTGFCAVGDGSNDAFAEVVDPRSSLYGFWSYRVAATGETFFGRANRIVYRPGALFTSSDTVSPAASMSATFRLDAAGSGTVRVTDRATGRAFVLRDRRTADDPPCASSAVARNRRPSDRRLVADAKTGRVRPTVPEGVDRR